MGVQRWRNTLRNGCPCKSSRNSVGTDPAPSTAGRDLLGAGGPGQWTEKFIPSCINVMTRVSPGPGSSLASWGVKLKRPVATCGHLPCLCKFQINKGFSLGGSTFQGLFPAEKVTGLHQRLVGLQSPSALQWTELPT